MVSAAVFQAVSGCARIRQFFLAAAWRLVAVPLFPFFPVRTRSSKMAAMQKAVVTIGQDKIIRSVNREAIRLFGYQRADELIGYAPPPPIQHLSPFLSFMPADIDCPSQEINQRSGAASLEGSA